MKKKYKRAGTTSERQDYRSGGRVGYQEGRGVNFAGRGGAMGGESFTQPPTNITLTSNQQQGDAEDEQEENTPQTTEPTDTTPPTPTTVSYTHLTLPTIYSV